MGWVSWPLYIFVFLASFSALWWPNIWLKWGFRNFFKKLLVPFITYLAFTLRGTFAWGYFWMRWVVIRAGGILSPFMGTACWLYKLIHGPQKQILVFFFVWKFGFWPGEVTENHETFFLRFLWEPFLYLLLMIYSWFDKHEICDFNHQMLTHWPLEDVVIILRYHLPTCYD